MNVPHEAVHPREVIDALRLRTKSRLILSFSQYLYEPQSPFDRRERFQVEGSRVTQAWVREQLDSLPVGWDLALESAVKLADGGTRHIPMIDFAINRLGPPELLHLRRLLGARRVGKFQYYCSGRSFHAYGLEFLRPKEWVEFMGRLLLLNLPGSPPIVDSRWIGHRLMAGYAALRWSANSPHYCGMPYRVDVPTHAARV